MNVLVTICARGGSKGIPGKNIRELNGLPLIAYSIKAAQLFLSEREGDIALSTDSDDIRKVALLYDVTTEYKRPQHLATDNAGKIETIIDVLKFNEKTYSKKYDYVLDLDVTSPLRTQIDLEKAFQILLADENALNIFSVNPSSRNPYFNMVEQKDNGYYGTVKKGKFATRQTAPSVYDMNASFYIYRKSFFEAGNTAAITDRSLIYLMEHLCFDLDHPIDFEFLNFLLSNDKLDFEI